jgi:hypothetical protein
MEGSGSTSPLIALIEAGKSAGNLDTSSHKASMPLSDAPMTNIRSFMEISLKRISAAVLR